MKLLLIFFFTGCLILNTGISFVCVSYEILTESKGSMFIDNLSTRFTNRDVQHFVIATGYEVAAGTISEWGCKMWLEMFKFTETLQLQFWLLELVQGTFCSSSSVAMFTIIDRHA